MIREVPLISYPASESDDMSNRLHIPCGTFPPKQDRQYFPRPGRSLADPLHKNTGLYSLVCESRRATMYVTSRSEGKLYVA